MPKRIPLLIAAACFVSAGFAAPARAALPLVGDLGQTVTTVTNTLSAGDVTSASTLTDLGGAVTGVTGTVGGLVTGTTSTLTDTLQGTLDQVTGAAGGLLPTNLLQQLLAPVSGTGTGLPGSGVAGATGTSGGVPSAIVDARAPNARFRILYGLKNVGRTGRLRVRVSLDEPGVVIFSPTVRPGRQTKAARRSHRGTRYSRKPVHFPAAALAFRQPGALRVTIRLSRRVQRRLGQARDGRMALALVTADLSRNQAASRQKKHLHR
jgi:hypothetical protein